MNLRAATGAVMLLGLAGCLQPQTRFQSAEDTDREVEVKTIGDVTTVDNADAIAISGVGLVTGLAGTGGGAPPGSFRTVLEADLKQKGITNTKEILDSKDTSLVLVSALVPAGARKGDPLDVEISLPEGSRTTSLRGGYLQECFLFNYDTTHGVNPGTTRANTPLRGHKLAKAKGPLLVGFGDGDDTARQRQGRIWGGGINAIDRAFYLVLNNDQQYARVAMRIAERVNETFQGAYRGPSGSLAEAKTKTVVYLRVPMQYKHNQPRFLRVVRLMPLQENPSAASPYRKKLEEDLLDPARTVTAALRLEAIGIESIPILKRGLTSDHVLVRFTSAEALTYLGSPAGGEELAKMVKDQPALRSYALTALASLDETICHFKLQELLSEPSAEARYGAFRALRALRENDEMVRGELLNESFWLHKVAPGTPSLVHISTMRRAEVVLFGEEVFMEPPFNLLAGSDFTVVAGRDDDKCTIRSFSQQAGPKRRQCSLKLADIIRTLAEVGGAYPDAVDLLRKADQCRCVTGRVVVDALPQATTVYDLARTGQLEEGEAGSDLLKTDKEVLDARSDFGATPTLFEGGEKPRPKRGAAN